uniref:uncharacterized protein LOC125906571 n=1 Tax=Anopheles coluzzii TaxID=1518534 RepID=UPI0020FF9E9B|nr:uncharacterized protein LOC125906571 [Anopheles coluzzii]
MYFASSHDSSHICLVRNVNKHGQPPVKIVCRIIVKFYVKTREKEKHHFIPKFGNIRPSMVEQLCVCVCRRNTTPFLHQSLKPAVIVIGTFSTGPTHRSLCIFKQTNVAIHHKIAWKGKYYKIISHMKAF